MCIVHALRSSMHIHVNGPITPFDWVVDGCRCCAGDAIGGRAVATDGKGRGRVVVGGGKALGCPWVERGGGATVSVVA